MKQGIIFLLIYLCPWFISDSCCWGFKAHKNINHRSILFLPRELSIFYKSYSLYLSEHAPDADKRKRFQKEEKYKHYINIDVYDSFPFSKVPRDIKKATLLFEENTIKQNGVLPWHIEKNCAQLTKAFKEKNIDKILKLSTDLGHYVGDATVPLHITKNYNGQLSNQEGIHSLWETQCIHQIDLDTVKIDIKPAIYIQNINKEIWKIILESYLLAEYVLKTEKKVSLDFSESEKYHIKTQKNKIKKTYNSAFINRYLAENKKIILERMYKASYFLSCLYYTCWVNAGQPNLNNTHIKHTIKKDFDNDGDEHDDY